MVNFHDPAVELQNYITMVKFWHTMDGLFIWEFFTTLSYEWSVIRGRRPYRWTIWIYSLTRLSALVTVIFDLITFNFETSIGCQATFLTQFIFAYVSLSAASLLIVLRIIAIWNKNKVVVAIAVVIWIADFAFLAHGVLRLRVEWVSDVAGCEMVKLESIKLSVIAAFVTDSILLLIMLLGLLRLRLHRGGTFALGRLMWKQGVLWFIIATICEIPPTVFICLNLNDAFNLMFLMPWLITLSIAATRMYRTLADFGSSTISHESAPDSHTVPRSRGTPAAPATLARLEVAVHRTYEEHRKSPMNHGSPSVRMDMDEQLQDKPGALILNDNREIRMES